MVVERNGAGLDNAAAGYSETIDQAFKSSICALCGKLWKKTRK